MELGQRLARRSMKPVVQQNMREQVGTGWLGIVMTKIKDSNRHKAVITFFKINLKEISITRVKKTISSMKEEITDPIRERIS